MRKLLLLVMISFAFTASTVSADSDHDPHAAHQMSNTDEGKMDMGSIDNEHGNLTRESESSNTGHDHGSVGPETPANVLVLSIFGVVNAAFLLIGVIHKMNAKRRTVTL